MEVFDAIYNRSSVRKFKPDVVSEEDIKKIIEAGIRAPTAGNVQPWFFYAVTNEEIKSVLSSAALGQKFVKEAPVVIVTCVNPEASARTYGDRGRALYCLQDAAAAIENMMLAAVSMDLGTCWVGAFDEEKVAGILEISSPLRPVALIPVGYPAASGNSPRRLSVNEVVHFVK